MSVSAPGVPVTMSPWVWLPPVSTLLAPSWLAADLSPSPASLSLCPILAYAQPATGTAC